MATRRRARTPAYLTPPEVARRLRVSERTLRRMIAAGIFPAPVRHAGAGDPVWPRRVVAAYVELAPWLPDLFRLPGGKQRESNP